MIGTLDKHATSSIGTLCEAWMFYILQLSETRRETNTREDAH